VNGANKWLRLGLVCLLCIGFATLVALLIERF